MRYDGINLRSDYDLTTQIFPTTRELMPKETQEKTPHVNPGDIPVWLGRRARRLPNNNPGQSIKQNALSSFYKAGIELDHWGTVHEGSIFVSEPYYRITDDHSKAKAFAESIHCKLVVSSESYHCPGRTIRLAFLPEPLFERLLDPKVFTPLSEYDPSLTSRKQVEK